MHISASYMRVNLCVCVCVCTRGQMLAHAQVRGLTGIRRAVDSRREELRQTFTGLPTWLDDAFLVQ